MPPAASKSVASVIRAAYEVSNDSRPDGRAALAVMHRALRAAGIEAELHVLEGAPHGGFFGTAPEDDELDREVRRFVDAHWRT